LDVSGILIEAS